MATVAFTANLQRHLPAPTSTVTGETVAACLQTVFEQQPSLRDYILDEHGAVRKHVVVFVNGQPIQDRTELTDAVAPTDEIYVMQALSGG